MLTLFPLSSPSPLCLIDFWYYVKKKKQVLNSEVKF
jgi:hypothetical protein